MNRFFGHTMWGANFTLIVAIFVTSNYLYLSGLVLGIIHESLQFFFNIPHSESPKRAVVDVLDFTLGGLFASTVIMDVPWWWCLVTLSAAVGFAIAAEKVEWLK